ncbi:septation protein IspZ [Colwellia sp. 1_MG-2023]|uniref:septation protein IspZ n=1 Tax=unclassified Colwellia TaxID=196834 RepID=UPI001C08DFDD|nr:MULTISPECIES: septation protein IspZ [unclassified Colwellia]MBU2925327.1 septation protein IspZ [Colwellia sp. C2M11]MDO6650757.1 septation protein IspZ [Colwellia sp. 3_MG-2023]MDO6663792.1 septation protein IspZ [Colwellia sp. 2_MG-2023]MDO6688143.1 septation protein IspZ [Colwellia sp. 1_MG-2023]
MTMRLWTFKRPFHYDGNNYEVRYSFSLKTYTSELFYNGTLVDKCSHLFDGDFKVVVHKFQPTNQANNQTNNQAKELQVSVGYFSWLNVGIEVREGSSLIYESHPGKDIHFATNKLKNLGVSHNSIEANDQRKLQSEKWQKNKPSIFADIGTGAAFFIVAKVTGDLTIAAFTGVVLGLALVVAQRFVKVDLLGGFAVFGTIMLLISAIFSIAFQSEYLVQLKGTFMGLLSASALIIDGVFNKGGYFGSRFERYLNSPIQHRYFVLGLALIGLCMAGLNYSVASQLTEDQWLTYDTFVETPIYLVMFFILVWRAGKKLA